MQIVHKLLQLIVEKFLMQQNTVYLIWNLEKKTTEEAF